MTLIDLGSITWAVYTQTDHIQAIAMIFTVEVAEDGHFFATRRTPGGPEINQHDLPSQSRQIEILSTQLSNRERWRCLSNIRAEQVRSVPKYQERQ